MERPATNRSDRVWCGVIREQTCPSHSQVSSFPLIERPSERTPDCHTEGVPVDIRAVLHRVVEEVFDHYAFRKEEDDHEAPYAYRMLLSSLKTHNGRERHASLVASYEWFEVHVIDLDVGTIRFDYDGNEADKEAELRDLAHLARAYLQGEGEVTYRPSLIRRRPLPTLTVETNGIRWRLGRSTSSGEKLEDSP